MKKRDINSQLKERILLLDGALGTMLQRYNLSEAEFRGVEFQNWDKELKGCNDILSLTREELVADVARQYLEAGSDIITTNTFNANAISLADYGLEDYAYRISKTAAEILRKEADKFEQDDQRPRFVAGSLGPTNRTASMSADVSNPAAREVTFDQLVEAYKTQVEGLLDGGADVILLETIFDTLNAKAALYAIERVSKQRGHDIDILASGTLTDASARTLSGQTIEAFYNSLTHAKLVSIGFNCAFGARQMMPYLEQLSNIAGCYISAYPNAGLPNIMGGYDETPQMFLADVEEFLKRGIINIIGGCCGTTPQHIKLISEVINNYSPRQLPSPSTVTTLSGLEPLHITPQTNFVNIGERSNVAGSAKFARLICEGSYEEALSVVRSQVDAGAQIIDVCMDDGMIDGVQAMHHFLCLIGSEPEIARVPIMIDSSKWEVLMAGLKVSQGKSIVNSISLKEGEVPFVEKAMEIHRMGAAVVVMLFDEEGQADTFERKIEIAERAYKILVDAGFPSYDIIFDPNILSVATGIEAHDSYGKAFIDATRWIKENLPNVKVSGGVSNLSFAFRGNNVVREAMHSAFLYHAIEAGMDMAIVNAQMLQVYDQIEPDLLSRIEDVILCRRSDASERLIEYAEQLKDNGIKIEGKGVEQWRDLPLADRIGYAMAKGITDHIEADTLEGFELLGSPMKVIEELLMPAMEHVGRLFGKGKMFLPQVVKTARVMKQAVGVLTPYIDKENSDSVGGGSGRVVIATVKGDVHDIGKNIVSVVMACNGYEIEDLGVMVETLRIVDEAVAMSADVICLSGLITPSLDEMIRVVQECEKRGLNIPIILGGATTSPIHTAVKIAPHYSGVVVHARNASDNPKILSQLLSGSRLSYIKEVKDKQEVIRNEYDKALKRRELLSLKQLRDQRVAAAYEDIIEPNKVGYLDLFDVDIADVEPFIDWSFFFSSWGLKGRYPQILQDVEYGKEATKLFADAQSLLKRIKKSKSLTLEGRIAILPAYSDNDDIVVQTVNGEQVRLPMLRNQTAGEKNISLADFLAEKDDYIGCFALTVGVGLDGLIADFEVQYDRYSAMMSKLLADRLAEAFLQMAHRVVRCEMWGYESNGQISGQEMFNDKYRGVRVAFGYSSSPDHSLKRDVFQILDIENSTHMTLSENYMISPAESLCGVMFSRGQYFSVGLIDDEQLKDYAQRRGVTFDEVKKLIPFNI